MKFCTNCGKQLEDYAAFCSECGLKQEAQEPKASEQTFAQPASEPIIEPQATTAPQPEAMEGTPVLPSATLKGKIMGFVSFGLSVFGAFFSSLTFLLALAMDDEPAILAITYSIMFIVCPILGIVFSGIAQRENNTMVFPKLGKILGIVATALFGLSFILAIPSL